MPFAVVFEPRAVREMTEARAWWAERGRPIDDAIAKALRLLEHFPAMAAHWQGRERSAVRRLSVGRTGYHFYYRLNRDAALIVVVAFWHERRRPPLL